jgi:hypothetical protein
VDPDSDREHCYEGTKGFLNGMKPGFFVTGNRSISKFIDLEPDRIPIRIRIHINADPHGSDPHHPASYCKQSGANALYPNNTEKSKIWRTPTADYDEGRRIWAKLQTSPTPTTATVKFRKKSTISCDLCLQKMGEGETNERQPGVQCIGLLGLINVRKK